MVPSRFAKLMLAKELLLYRRTALDVFDTPMAADTLTRIREPPSAANPLVDRVPQARSILGLGLFIARCVRMDCLFPALALSQYIVNNLTTVVWSPLLR